MAAAKPPSKPRDLHAAGAALWRQAVREFSFNSIETALLHELCRVFDEIDEMRSGLSALGVTTKGSRGQQVLNPLLAQLTAHRRSADRLALALALPIGNETMGRRRTAAAKQAASTPRIKLAPKVAAIRSKQERDSRGA
jgi:hypothetical protein